MGRLHNTAPIDAAELLALAVAVVRPAADLARELRARGVGDVTTKSTDTDVVTAADRAVERQVRAALAAARPFDRILGEEFGAAQPDGSPAQPDGSAAQPDGGAARPEGGSSVRWILDPIDGTVNYLYGLGQYAVSLAAEVDGEVIAGVVCNAATGEEWTATRGGGAYAGAGSANQAPRRLTGSSETRLGQALVGTGFAYDPVRRAYQAKVLAGLITEIRDIRRFGSAAIDLCLAAEGRYDAYYEQGLNAWDHAAGGLVASEAGLLVTGLAGAPPGPAMLVAAPPALHAQLVGHLAKLDAAGGP